MAPPKFHATCPFCRQEGQWPEHQVARDPWVDRVVFVAQCPRCRESIPVFRILKINS